MTNKMEMIKTKKTVNTVIKSKCLIKILSMKERVEVLVLK